MLPGVSNAENWYEQKQDEATQSYSLPRSLNQKTREKRRIRNQYLQSSVINQETALHNQPLIIQLDITPQLFHLEP